MKRILLILTVLISALPGLGAQDKGKKDWHDKWKAEKIAYLTDALDLTSAEAEKFWPVYNKCEREKRNSFKVSMDAYKALDEAIKAGKGTKKSTLCWINTSNPRIVARILIVNMSWSTERYFPARRWRSCTSRKSHSAGNRFIN